MTREEAIKLMSSSTTINSWNNNREIVKKKFNVTTDENGQLVGNADETPGDIVKRFLKSPIPEIDSSGLITKILPK